MAKVVAIAAMDLQRGIGRDGRLPWSVREDLEHFKQLTMGNIVVVGRTTYEKLPQLDGRTVVVVSSSFSDRQRLLRNCVGFSSFKMVVDHFRNDRGLLWVAGGAKLYESTLAYWTRLHLTVINGSYECDTRMPAFEHRSVGRVTRQKFSAGEFQIHRFR